MPASDQHGLPLSIVKGRVPDQRAIGKQPDVSRNRLSRERCFQGLAPLLVTQHPKVRARAGDHLVDKAVLESLPGHGVMLLLPDRSFHSILCLMLSETSGDI